MPVTKTAKRALRASKRKEEVNNRIRSSMDASIRKAKKEKTKKAVKKAVSLTDKAVKKNIIHKNKAARIKSRLDKILSEKSKGSSSSSKKSSKK